MKRPLNLTPIDKWWGSLPCIGFHGHPILYFLQSDDGMLSLTSYSFLPIIQIEYDFWYKICFWLFIHGICFSLKFKDITCVVSISMRKIVFVKRYCLLKYPQNALYFQFSIFCVCVSLKLFTSPKSTFFVQDFFR